MAEASGRLLPEIGESNEFFWKSGADGTLRFQRCSACGELRHPPSPVCPYCHSHRVGAGRGVGTGRDRRVHGQRADVDPELPAALRDRDRRHRGGRPRTAHHQHRELRARRRPRRACGCRCVFEPAEDVWIPLFEPSGDPEKGPFPADDPEIHRARPMPRGAEKFEDKVALTGIGMSKVGRRLMVDPIALTVEAAERAIADAGLTPDDIDGLSTYPGGAVGSGMSEGGITALEEALRLRPSWINGGMDLPGQAGSVIAAMLAVAGGLCNHVLCFRTVWEATYAARQRAAMSGAPGSASAIVPQGSNRVGGDMQWRLPYGAIVGRELDRHAGVGALRPVRHDRETLGWIALNARKNAARTPWAIYKDPLTMDDYLNARMITTPFGLYDCDVPCDGSVAIIVSRRDLAADMKQKPVHVEAVGTQITERVSWDQGTLDHEPQVTGPAAHLWTRTDLTPADIDFAELYDGFSFNCLSWIEALGFCGWGEAKDFLEGGTGSRSTARCRSTPTAGSCRRAASTGTASCTRRSPSCGATPANGRSRTPRPRSSAAAAARPAGASSSRSHADARGGSVTLDFTPSDRVCADTAPSHASDHRRRRPPRRVHADGDRLHARGRRRRGRGAVRPSTDARRSPRAGATSRRGCSSATRSALDRMTVMLPELLYRRLEEIGLDFALLYPTSGLSVLSNPDDELRQAAARALNTYYARVFAEYRDRLEPVAVIPTFTPDEAVAELDHAVGVLGFKAVVMSGVVPRSVRPDGSTAPLGRHARPRQPLRLRAAVGAVRGARRRARVPRDRLRVGQPGVAEELRLQPPGQLRRRPGGGVPLADHGRRADAPPELRLSFLEGGVAWAAQLYADLLGHYEKRNRDAVQMFDPARFDVAQASELFAEFANGPLRDYRDRVDEGAKTVGRSRRGALRHRRLRRVGDHQSRRHRRHLHAPARLRMRGRRPDERARVQRHAAPPRRPAERDVRLRHRPLGRARRPRGAARGVGARRGRPPHGRRTSPTSRAATSCGCSPT